VADKVESIAGVEARKMVVLDQFYLGAKHESVDPNTLLDSEIRMFGGMGKKVLCLALRLLTSYFQEDIVHNNTLMILEASGGGIRTAADKEEVKRLTKMGISKSRARERVSAQNNHKLVKYYTNVLGFQNIDPIEEDSTFVRMWSLFKSVLEKCS
jgi:hypothetical protein